MMKKKQTLSEGLLNSIVGTVMNYAIKRNIKNDPEFRQSITDLNKKIADLTIDIENTFAEIERRRNLRLQKKN